MSRTSTPITATGALVRNAVEMSGRTSDDLTIDLTVDLADVLALLTDSEKLIAGGHIAGHNLVFAVGIASDGVAPEGQLLRVGIQDSVRNALRASFAPPTDPGWVPAVDAHGLPMFTAGGDRLMVRPPQ